MSMFRGAAVLLGAFSVGLACVPLLGASEAGNAGDEIAQLRLQLERERAVNEVSNLMSTYTYLQFSDLQNETANLYALKTPGVSVELPSGGAMVGGDHVKAFYAQSQKSTKPDGQFRLHPMQTPVIVVAGDGKTAKGVFLSLGAGANSIDDEGVWAWVRYGVDFIKEDGVWKIWHLHGFPILSTSYSKSWTVSAKERAAGGGRGGPPGGGGGAPAGGSAGAPPGGGAPGGAGGPPPGGGGGGMMQPDRQDKEKMWEYNGKGLPPLQPALPQPYETFDPATAY
ncbi:MAG: nuclear transport factor 2 family protein [Steroidobacteraceae bacterium]